MVLEKFAFNKNDIVDEFERIENLTEVKNISKALDFSISIKKYLEETLADSQLDVLSLVNLDYDKKEKIVKYTNSAGIMELRESFSKSYAKDDINLLPEEILITQGGSEAIQITLQTLCNPGDEVLVPEPYYTNYDSFLRIADATLVPIETSIEDHYHLPSREEIEKLITPKTKAIMFSNPSNPTGIVFRPEEMELIKEIAIKYDLYIVTDEVYRQFIYDEKIAKTYQSFMSIPEIEDRVILVDSISKHYSATGARIGVIASKNKDFMAQALKFCQARVSVSTIEQYAVHHSPVKHTGADLRGRAPHRRSPPGAHERE
mgnify:CR=1 FL=1